MNMALYSSYYIDLFGFGGESCHFWCYYEDSSWLLRGLWFMSLYFRSVWKTIDHALKNLIANRGYNVTLVFQATTYDIIVSIRTPQIGMCSFLCFLRVFPWLTELFLNCFNNWENSFSECINSYQIYKLKNLL